MTPVQVRHWRTVTHVKLAVACVSVAAAVLLVSCSGDVASGSAISVSDTASLVRSPVPVFPVPCYVTSGSLVNVRDANVDTSRVNTDFRKLILSFENQYIGEIRSLPPSPARSTTCNSYGGHGTLRVTPERSLTLANSAVASALIPVLALFPGGNDGGFWTSGTYEVRSGKSINLLSAIYKRPTYALSRITAFVLSSIVNGRSEQDLCVDDASWLKANLPSIIRSPLPTLAQDEWNETGVHLALTPRGLAVGFDQAELGIEACGTLEVTVPYKTLWPLLNPFGKGLVTGTSRS